jgi:hypothetical protein
VRNQIQTFLSPDQGDSEIAAITTMVKKTVTAKEGKNKNKMKEQGKR